MYRHLSARDPEARTSLLEPLNTVATLLRELGRATEARTVSDEAVAVARQLAVADPVAHRGTVLQVVTDGVTHGAEVLRRGELAVTEARRLAAVHPHSGPAALASLLYGIVPWLAAAGEDQHTPSGPMPPPKGPPRHHAVEPDPCHPLAEVNRAKKVLLVR